MSLVVLTDARADAVCSSGHKFWDNGMVVAVVFSTHFALWLSVSSAESLDVQVVLEWL